VNGSTSGPSPLKFEEFTTVRSFICVQIAAVNGIAFQLNHTQACIERLIRTLEGKKPLAKPEGICICNACGARADREDQRCTPCAESRHGELYDAKDGTRHSAGFHLIYKGRWFFLYGMQKVDYADYLREAEEDAERKLERMKARQ
jgi:hypothetical protein